jgi:uncharacterized protein
MEPTSDYRKYTWIAGTVALVCISLAALALGLSEMKSLKHPNGTVATITVSGEGEVTALPDIATVTFTVRESAKTVPEAQRLAEVKIEAALKALKALNIDEKDTKTLSYTVNPKYENVVYSGYMSSPKIIGYEVAQSMQVKVRAIDNAGAVIGALGGANITEISGPEFTVDDMDVIQAEAKEKAIAQAREKAKATAKALGASLGVVTQYNEDTGGYYPYPAYMKAEAGSAQNAVRDVSLPQGENVIKSRVTITYSLN